MEFRTLGGLEVVDRGAVLPLGGAKERILLGLLLANRGSVVSADTMTEALWGDSPPTTARATLQTHVSKLRRVLTSSATSPSAVALVNRPPGYVLQVAEAQVDAACFEDLLARGRELVTTFPAEAVDLLDAALALWRGPAFAEFADAPWALPEATRLEELRLVALEERTEARLAVGDHAVVVSELEGLLRDHPLRERLWTQQMVALARSGRQAEALRVANTLRRHLADELGLEPSAELVTLERAVASGEQALLHPRSVDGDRRVGRSDAFAPGDRRPAPHSGFGAAGPVTELIGRDEDLDLAAAAISSARVVTLTGTGGVGKSALAAELARRSADTFGDGVAVVELATLHDDAGVLAAVARSVEVERRGERSLTESVLDALGSKDLLLVLDNCEHVLGTVGEFVARLVRWCPGVRVLATSREPIGTPGETVRPVSPLGLPQPDASVERIREAAAVQVFVARAREASPTFELGEHNAQAVAELCIQLDGLPLALELAAARMASMSPRELADRLHPRASILRSGHGREARHQTLRDVVQWSYELLTEDERVLFGRLSVFAGGFDLDAAERVCGVGALDPAQVAGLLSGLVDKSLVVADHAGGAVRYRMLETLREYGAERLFEQPEATEVARSHLATFVALAEQAEIAMEGPDEGAWIARLDAEFANLRTAIAAAVDTGDTDSALRLTAAVREYAFRRIRYEVVDWAELAVELDGAGSHPRQPTVLGVVAYGHFVRGDLHRAVEIADRAIATRDELGVLPCGLPERVLGNAHFYLGHREVAIRWMDRLGESARTCGVAGRIAHYCYMRSVAHTSLGERSAGSNLAEAATEAATVSGSPTALAEAAYASGLAMAGSDPVSALELLEQSAALAEQVDNRWIQAFAMTESMWLKAREGSTAAALRGYESVVETWFRGGDWANQWLSLRQLAGVLAGAGQDEEAALLFGAVEAAGAATALPFAPFDSEELDRAAHALSERLGADAMAEAKRRGAVMSDDAVVTAALGAIARVEPAQSAED